MIPVFNNVITNDDDNSFFSDTTYKIDFENKRVAGKTKGLNSIKQSILKTLNTERFSKEIYSDTYGVELERFIGSNIDFIKSDLERTIVEALIVDDRINKISNFKITSIEKDSLCFSFLAETNDGFIDIEGGVNL